MMSELVIARIRRELDDVDNLNNELYAALSEGTMKPLHLWLEIKKKASRHEGVDAAEIERFIRRPVSSARALYLIELMARNRDKRLHPYLLSFLDHEYWLVRRYACSELGRTNDLDVRDELQKRLSVADDELRKPLIDALANFSHEEVPDYLLEEVRCEDERSRRNAIEALAKIQSGKANELLLELLHDKRESVAGNAEKELGNPLRTGSLLLMRLREFCIAGDAKLKIRAVRLLGEHRDIESTNLLASMYERGSRKLRQQILLALGHIGTQEAMESIIELSRDEPNAETVAYRCMALSKLPFLEAVEAMMKVYRERRFGDGRIELFMHGNLYLLAAECIKRSKCTEAIPSMIELLDSDNPTIRMEVAKGLGTRKAMEALGKMEEVLAQEEDEEVKGALERACKKLRRESKKVRPGSV
jgi:HEAT repeat protein